MKTLKLWDNKRKKNYPIFHLVYLVYRNNVHIWWPMDYVRKNIDYIMALHNFDRFWDIIFVYKTPSNLMAVLLTTILLSRNTLPAHHLQPHHSSFCCCFKSVANTQSHYSILTPPPPLHLPSNALRAKLCNIIWLGLRVHKVVICFHNYLVIIIDWAPKDQCKSQAKA